jgi:hypothetical protein
VESGRTKWREVVRKVSVMRVEVGWREPVVAREGVELSLIR